MRSLVKVVTTTEAARMLGLSESALSKLRPIGNGPVYMSRTFSRKTVLAALDALPFSHADMSRFLLELGPQYATRAGESISMQKRLNELMAVYDKDPDQRLEDGELLGEVIVAKAVTFIPPPPDLEWSASAEESPRIKALRAALARDGFTVANGTIRRTLPIELGIASAEDETTRMLKSGPFPISRGHLEQALDAHGRGDWAAANSQIRSFYESLLDEIAIAIDPSLAGPGKGEARRAWLAAQNFLRTDLNEWSNDGKNFVNGLMKRLHPHGCHPGLSDEADCTFRLHVVLLTARYFLERYESGRPN